MSEASKCLECGSTEWQVHDSRCSQNRRPESKTTKCRALSKSTGKPCKKDAKPGSYGKCWQHSPNQSKDYIDAGGRSYNKIFKGVQPYD